MEPHFGIYKAADSLGFIAIGLSGTEDELLKSIENKEIAIPFISRIITSDGLEHFVVIFGFKRGKFVVGDPQIGKIVNIPKKEFFSAWQGEILCITPNKNAIKKMQENQKNEYIALIRKNKKWIFTAFVISLFLSAFALGTSIVIENIVNQIQYNSVNSTFVLTFTLLLVFITLLQILLGVIRGKVLTKLSAAIEQDLINNTLKSAVDLPISFYEIYRSGDILSRIMDIDKIVASILECSVSIILNGLLVILCSLLIFIKSNHLFVVLMGLMILYALAAWVFNKPIHNYSRNFLSKKAAYNSSIKDMIDKISMVKEYACEAYTVENIKKRMDDSVEANKKFTFLNFIQNAATTGISALGVVAVLSIGCILIMQNLLTLGQLMLVYSLIGYMLTPVGQIIASQISIVEAKEAVKRLDDIVKGKKEEKNSFVQQDIILENPTIKINNLSFRYGYRQQVLSNVNITIDAGTKVAFIGHSGSGKTTLAKLLLHLYDLDEDSGDIFLGEHNICDFSSKSLRSQIIYIPQKSSFVRGTIRENILLGMECSDDAIQEILYQHQELFSFIRELPLKLETLMEDNGDNFSEGQKQKIAILRAMIRSPRILIMDEATSNIDKDAEKNIINDIFSYCRKNNVTCILITHSISIAKQCDKIIKFKEGHIIANDNAS